MFDQQIIAGDSTTVKKGTTILIVPVDAIIPDDVKMKIYEWSWEGIIEAFSTEELPLVLMVDANDEPLLTSLARYHEKAVKTLQGLPTNYPSHWQITFSALPKIMYQELILAGENSLAKGGSGVQPRKVPKPEMKPLDPKAHDKLSEIAADTWSSDNVD